MSSSLSSHEYEYRLPRSNARCRIADFSSDLAVVLTHPWGPLGGNMHNNVVTAAALYFRRLRVTTLRLDFAGSQISRGNAQVGQVVEAADCLLGGLHLRMDGECHSAPFFGEEDVDDDDDGGGGSGSGSVGGAKDEREGGDDDDDDDRRRKRRTRRRPSTETQQTSSSSSFTPTPIKEGDLKAQTKSEGRDFERAGKRSSLRLPITAETDSSLTSSSRWEMDHRRSPPSAILLVGYSYGSLIASSASADIPRCVGCVSIAPPVTVRHWLLLFNSGHHLRRSMERPDLPRLIIMGSEDDFTTPDKFRDFVSSFPASSTTGAELKGANHFFGGRERDLMNVVGMWLLRTYATSIGNDLKRLRYATFSGYTSPRDVDLDRRRTEEEELEQKEKEGGAEGADGRNTVSSVFGSTVCACMS